MSRYLSEAFIIAAFFNLFLFGIALVMSLVFNPSVFSIIMFCLLVGTTLPFTTGVLLNKRTNNKG